MLNDTLMTLALDKLIKIMVMKSKNKTNNKN